MNKLLIAALAVLCFVIYANSLSNEFVFDDRPLIVNNPDIKSAGFLGRAFGGSMGYASIRKPESTDKPKRFFLSNYRPLLILSFYLDYKIWRLDTLGFHLTNILFHLANSILVYYLLLSIFNNKPVSQIASLLFLVHPIHTSAVSFISGRADLLAGFFMLWGMIFFLKFSRLDSRAYYWASLLCAILALLSRENAFFLFFFLALILFAEKAKPKYYLCLIPFMLLDMFYLMLKSAGYQGPVTTVATAVKYFDSLSLSARIINFFNIIPRYLLLLIFPLDLHPNRTTPLIKNLIDFRVCLPVIFILFIIAIAIRFRKEKLILFSIAWFFVGMLPILIYLDMSNISGRAFMREHFLYLPSIGFFAICAYIFSRLHKLGRILLCCFAIFYGSLTVINNTYWKNEIVLYNNILRNAPENNHLRLNLINAYLTKGLNANALEEIRVFAVHYPDSPHLYYAWGNYYFATGNLKEAIKNYKAALEKDKKFFFAYYYLSLCFEAAGKLDEARGVALQGYEVSPYFLPNLVRLGDLYSVKKDPLEAKRYYNLALEIEPDNRLIREKLKNAE